MVCYVLRRIIHSQMLNINQHTSGDLFACSSAAGKECRLLSHCSTSLRSKDITLNSHELVAHHKLFDVSLRRQRHHETCCGAFSLHFDHRNLPLVKMASIMLLFAVCSFRSCLLHETAKAVTCQCVEILPAVRQRWVLTSNYIFPIEQGLRLNSLSFPKVLEIAITRISIHRKRVLLQIFLKSGQILSSNYSTLSFVVVP